MTAVHLIDTGPLVALLNRKERHHAWIRDLFSRLQPPLLTCEPVLTEACFLLQRLSTGPAALLELVSRGIILPAFPLLEQVPPVMKLMATYANVPMSLADACLVRLSELHPTAKLITLDSDFKIYRRRSRQVIPLLIPE